MTRVLKRRLISSLAGPLRVLRGAPRLLVFDFDGTLAPLTGHPRSARLSARCRRRLSSLGRQNGTVVAVLSGRSLEDLRRLVPKGLVVAGNHGLRASLRGAGVEANALKPYRAAVRFRRAGLKRLAMAVPGALVEFKGCGVALHYRNVHPARVEALLRSARSLFRGSGLSVLAGKKVLEFCPPLGRGKAGGLRRLATRLAAGWNRTGTCLFVGDDRTDEDAFKAARALGQRALAVKVGYGATQAPWRFASRAQVDALLTALVKAPPVP